MGAQLVLGHLLAGVQNHDGADGLVKAGIVKAGDKDGLDGGVDAQDRLDLRRGDVDAAAFDQLLAPALELHPARIVQQSQIASQKKAVIRHASRRGFGIVQIAGHDVAAQGDLPHRALGLTFAGFQIQDYQFHALQRRAAGQQALFNRRPAICDGGVAVGFRQAVDVADLLGAQIDNHLHLLRRADGGARAQAGQVVFGAVGMLRQG